MKIFRQAKGVDGGTVASVFGRIGVVVAAINDYTWAQINKAGSNLADLATKNHSSLTLNDGTNPHGTTKTNVGLGSVTNKAQVAKDGSIALTADWNAGNFNILAHHILKTQTLTDQATITWDCDSGGFATVTLAGNRTLAAVTNQTAGGHYFLIVKQNGSAPRTLAWNANYLFPGGTDPVLSTGNNEVDIFEFISDGTNMYGVANYNFS